MVRRENIVRHRYRCIHLIRYECQLHNSNTSKYGIEKKKKLREKRKTTTTALFNDKLPHELFPPNELRHTHRTLIRPYRCRDELKFHCHTTFPKPAIIISFIWVKYTIPSFFRRFRNKQTNKQRTCSISKLFCGFKSVQYNDGPVSGTWSLTQQLNINPNKMRINPSKFMFKFTIGISFSFFGFKIVNCNSLWKFSQQFKITKFTVNCRCNSMRSRLFFLFQFSRWWTNDKKIRLNLYSATEQLKISIWFFRFERYTVVGYRAYLRDIKMYALVLCAVHACVLCMCESLWIVINA